MKIRKFKDFLFEDFDGVHLNYYSFDIDDNIFHMPTVIHMDRKVNDKWVPTDVSTSEFAEVRNDRENWRLTNNDPGEAFSEFRDTGKRGNKAFIEDMIKAISTNQLGPSWRAFVKCLTEGSIFSLITARGNEPSTYRNAVEYIIDNVLSDDEKFLMYSNCLKHAYIFGNEDTYDRIPKGQLSKTPLIIKYLDNCDFYGVSSTTFQKEFGETSPSNPEKAKELALDKFIDKCNEFGKKVGAKSVSIGFSDDDPKNVDHVKKYFKEKSALSNELLHKLRLSVHKTTDRTLIGGEKTKYYERSDSSIVPFTKWNSMSANFYPQNNEDPYTNQFKNQIGQIKDLTNNITKKKLK